MGAEESRTQFWYGYRRTLRIANIDSASSCGRAGKATGSRIGGVEPQRRRAPSVRPDPHPLPRPQGYQAKYPVGGLPGPPRLFSLGTRGPRTA